MLSCQWSITVRTVIYHRGIVVSRKRTVKAATTAHFNKVYLLCIRQLFKSEVLLNQRQSSENRTVDAFCGEVEINHFLSSVYVKGCIGDSIAGCFRP